MPTNQKSRHCRTCAKYTLHAKETMSFSLGCLATIFTAGLFLPIWLLADVAGILRPYRCQTCGRAAPPSIGGILFGIFFLALLAAFIYGLTTL